MIDITGRHVDFPPRFRWPTVNMQRPSRFTTRVGVVLSIEQKRSICWCDFCANQPPDMPKGYFSDFTWGKFWLYLVAAVYVIGVGIVSVLEPFMELPCDESKEGIKFPNPVYPSVVCLDTRYAILFGFSRAECRCARRLVASVILGGFIGWERRQADR